MITVEFKTPVNAAMLQPQWKFVHANGDIKPKTMSEAEMKKVIKTS
jgi:hypothetical protein